VVTKAWVHFDNEKPLTPTARAKRASFVQTPLVVHDDWGAQYFIIAKFGNNRALPKYLKNGNDTKIFFSLHVHIKIVLKVYYNFME
jgi:hypothetical protein